ncbi:MAG: hypothetical protein OXF94_11805 [Gammaproteobacteria bacterium]|nr:hypothetical protein [Gammaproteobacteria bacterium]
MDKIRTFIPFVKSQADFHYRQADRYADDERRRGLHFGTAEKFSDLLSLLKEIKEWAVPIDHAGTGLMVSPGELKDLPDELIKELNVTDSDKMDYSIVELVNEHGGIASLDRILVGLYLKTHEVQKRHNLNARIYRMMQKGLLHSVPGKKGVYSSRQLSEEEIESLR